MTLAGLSPAGVLLVRAGEPLVLRFILQDADGHPQDLIGRTFALTMRRSSRIVPIVTIAGELTQDGAAVMIAITAEQATALYESGQSQALSYDFVELSGGASITRWTARVNVAEGPELPSDIVPIWIELPYSEATLNIQTIAVRERGARGRSPQEVYFDAGLIDAPTIEAFDQRLKQNQTWATTAELEAANVSGGSAVLTEDGKAGLFTVGNYEDYVAEVAADTGKLNYIRSTSNSAKVWVRASIQQQAAAQIGAMDGEDPSTVQDLIEKIKSLLIPRTRNILTLEEVGARPWYSDNQQYFQQWFEDLHNYRCEGVITNPNQDGAQAVYMTTPVEVAVTRPLKITGRDMPVVMGVADTAVDPRAVIFLTCDQVERPAISVSGFRIDNSLRTFGEAVASGTCLTVRNSSDLLVQGMEFFAGLFSQTTIADKKGDSGVSATNCDSIRGMLNKFWGQPDKAWYISLFTRMSLWGNKYLGCNTVVGMTRAGKHWLDVSGETVYRCGQGYEIFWWDGLGYFEPAGCMTVRGVRFEECEGRLIYAQGGGTILANQIFVRKWGYKPREAAVGNYIGSTSRAPVRLDGASNCVIDIDMDQAGWPDTDQHRGFDLRNFTGGGQLLTCKGNRLTGRIANIPNGLGVVETGGTRGTFSDIIYENVATARNGGYGASPISTGQLTNSLHIMRDLDGKVMRRKNNIDWAGYFTMLPAAINQPNLAFGAPRVNECYYERTGEKTVNVHLKITAPYTMGEDSRFTGGIAGTSLTIASIALGTIGEQAIRGDGVAPGTAIVPVARVVAGIVGNLLTVTQRPTGAGNLAVGYKIYGTGVTPTTVTEAVDENVWRVADAQSVPAGTEIKSLGPVNGGPGVYRVNISQTVVSGTTIRGLNDAEIRLQRQVFAVASGTGSIVPDTASLPLSRGIMTVTGTGWAVGQTVASPVDGAVLSGTVIIDDLGGGTYRVSRSQTVAAGALVGNSTATIYATGRIDNDTLTVSSGAALALGQGFTGVTDGAILPGTVVTEILGGGVYKVNLSQTVPAGTKMKSLPSGLPWPAAARGGGDAEGATGIDAGLVWPEGARGLVGQIPAGRDFERLLWLGPEGVSRTMSVRDLDSSGTGSFRIQTSISYRCEEDQ